MMELMLMAMRMAMVLECAGAADVLLSPRRGHAPRSLLLLLLDSRSGNGEGWLKVMLRSVAVNVQWG